jgi:thymidylate synthase
MKILRCSTVANAWVRTISYLDQHGEKTSGLKEELNMIVKISDFTHDPVFDKHFRKIFGDERIDYASSYSFVDPRAKKGKKFLNEYDWKQNQVGKWTTTYWGRMISWNGTFNQIEQTIKRLKEHKSAKTISIMVFDPASDGRKVMGGMPCCLSIDIKPRPEGLNITAFFRSMRYTKSGYGDFDAFVKLGQFLASESGTKLASITFIAGSGHISSSGEEYQQAKTLLEKMNAEKNRQA